MSNKDSAVGFDRAPDRYSSEGRETIDRQRDLCHIQAERMIDMNFFPEGTSINMLADAMFSAHCNLCAMKYDDRNGKKDDPDQERSKSKWYMQMFHHIFGAAPDPRSSRDGFEPYVRPKGNPIYFPRVSKHVCGLCGWSDGRAAMGANCNHENTRIRLSCSSQGCCWWHTKSEPLPKTCPCCFDDVEWDEE